MPIWPPDRRQPALQRPGQGGEAAGQAAPVDGHDEADGGALLRGGVVVGAGDVVLHLLVDAALGVGHLHEAVLARRRSAIGVLSLPAL